MLHLEDDGRMRTTHFVNLAFIDFLASPRITLDLLSVHLPFGQEPDLVASQY